MKSDKSVVNKLKTKLDEVKRKEKEKRKILLKKVKDQKRMINQLRKKEERD